jgi:electron transport complex protein RnfD
MEGSGFIVSSSPHQRTTVTTPMIMMDVILALMPACFAGVWFFGLHALAMMVVCVASAVITEAALQKICGKPITVSDYSAAVTGLLVHINPQIPQDIRLPGG